MRSVRFVTYTVWGDGRVDLPLGAEIVKVITADAGGLGNQPTVVAVMVAEPVPAPEAGHD